MTIKDSVQYDIHWEINKKQKTNNDNSIDNNSGSDSDNSSIDNIRSSDNSDNNNNIFSCNNSSNSRLDNVINNDNSLVTKLFFILFNNTFLSNYITHYLRKPTSIFIKHINQVDKDYQCLLKRRVDENIPILFEINDNNHFLFHSKNNSSTSVNDIISHLIIPTKYLSYFNNNNNFKIYGIIIDYNFLQHQYIPKSILYLKLDFNLLVNHLKEFKIPTTVTFLDICNLLFFPSNLVPNHIKYLRYSFTNSFSQSNGGDVHNSIPSSVVHFELVNCTKQIPKGSLPSSISFLHYENQFNIGPIQQGMFPSQLKSLHFYSKQRLLAGSIPNTTTSLTLSTLENQNQNLDFLPCRLKYLKICSSISSISLYPNIFPQSLMYLEIDSIKEPIPMGTFPKNLATLLVSQHTRVELSQQNLNSNLTRLRNTCPYSKNLFIPPNLKELSIGNLDASLPLPHSLTSLKIFGNIYGVINSFPSNLSTLHVTYSPMITTGMIPSTVTKLGLSIQNSNESKIEQGIIPDSVVKLNLFFKTKVTEISIPSSVKYCKFLFGSQSRIYKDMFPSSVVSIDFKFTQFQYSDNDDRFPFELLPPSVKYLKFHSTQPIFSQLEIHPPHYNQALLPPNISTINILSHGNHIVYNFKDGFVYNEVYKCNHLDTTNKSVFTFPFD
ncbi:hypothetical protein CYY_004656 [Polysphondylium violaceum]|uniref:FNIP repeat-containing protein n=1 Tax=Polysphondylium violaceum TaxID=133409 RepID=A0A8J4V4Y4_9MYCE|nr:hypothetical protein CYY_004656 [Polysphondylium violaceum]